MLRTARTFKAPLIGCALVAIILTVPLTRGLGLDPGTASRVYRGWSEIQKNYPGPWRSEPLVIPTPFLSDDISFSLHEKERGRE